MANGDPMNTIVYLSYGRGDHIAETWFSIYSAIHVCGSKGLPRIVIYTDNPAEFDELPVEIRPIAADELDLWLGANGVRHRRKTCTIIDALKRFGGKVIFVDSDTWYIQPPAVLFDRICPGKTVLHIQETTLAASGDPEIKAFEDFLHKTTLTDTFGQPIDFQQATMWNSGVLGLDASDLPLMENALHLVDQVTALYDQAPFIEQFAAGHFFAHGSTTTEAHDVVFHYWPSYLRRPFDKALPSLLGDSAALSHEARARALYAQRPRATGQRLLKHMIRELLYRFGLRGSGVRNSG